MKRKDNYQRIVDEGINSLDLLRNIRTKKEVDSYLHLLLKKKDLLDFQRKKIQNILDNKELPWVLLYDEKNNGISQITEYIGNLQSEMAFGSAGTRPEESISLEAATSMQEMDGYDIEAFQYPKKIQQQWKYDFIVPIGIEIEREKYPYQTILHGFEKIKIEKTKMTEQAYKIVTEIKQRIEASWD